MGNRTRQNRQFSWKYGREISKKYKGKELKFLYVTEEDEKSSAYKEYFKKMLKKYGVDEPDKLSDKEKKKFFDEVDRGWKAKKETD